MQRNYFLAKLFVPLIKGSVSPQLYAIFGKLDFWRNIDRRGPYKNGENLHYLNLCLRKYFFAKLFVPLIKGSVSPQFYTIFGKLNFWRNINRRGPYKNGENMYYLNLCWENIFWQKHLFLSSKEVFLHNFTQFLENWIFEGISTGADLTKMVKIWTISICAKKKNFLANYLFHSLKEVFLHNFRQFLENWIFEGISTGATLQKWWIFELSLIVQRKYFLSKLFVPLIKGSVPPQF